MCVGESIVVCVMYLIAKILIIFIRSMWYLVSIPPCKGLSYGFHFSFK